MDITLNNMCLTMDSYINSVLENNSTDNSHLIQSQLSDHFRYEWTYENEKNVVGKDVFINFLISDVVGKTFKSQDSINEHSLFSSDSLISEIYFKRHFPNPQVNLEGWYYCKTKMINDF